MKRKSVSLLVFAFLWSCVAVAQQPAPPAQVTAIRAGHLIDPATGKVADNQVIVVKDGKIESVGGSVPQGAQVIDLSKQWVMPGLMDAHTHVTMNLPPAPAGVSAWESQYVKESSALRALEGLHMGEEFLQSGFTTIRDVGNAANFADTALRLAIEKGWFVGPTIINAGKIIGPFGGQSHGVSPEAGLFWQFEYYDADNPAEIRKAIHQDIYYGAKVIKLVADNETFIYTEEDIRAAADEAHKAGLKLAVHVYGGQAATNVINGGADSVEHGFALTDEQLQLMKQKGTFLAGTDFPYEHLAAFGGFVPLKARDTANQIQDRLARAYKAGVKMAFSTDTVVNLPGKNRGQMSMDFLAVWTKAGVPAPEILKAMTTNCAELLGVQKERGAIAASQYADIVATAANPLQDIEALRNVVFVMKEGHVVKK
jgi:imidazolonepropionase-like amidohydrolase